MKITVIGTGYVGLVNGTCFAELGNEVLCVDISAEKIEALKQGQIPIYEPGLEELVLRNAREGRLRFTTDFSEGMAFADLLICAVGTPPGEDHRADLSAVRTVAKNFGQKLDKYTIFMARSTIPVGTSHEVTKIIKEELLRRGKTEEEALALFSVADNPEFLKEGAAVKDFLNPNRIVVGLEDPRARPLIETLYRPLTRAGRSLLFTDLKSSELIKYASNAFLATKISFINEIADFCERSGANVREVARGVGLDSRIGSSFLHAGIGYGGSCFPKDVKALICSGKDADFSFQILEAVEAVNAKQWRRFVEKVTQKMGPLDGKHLAVWGLTFKPRTDDLREAPAIPILLALLEAGAHVQAFDPVGMPGAQLLLKHPNLSFSKRRDEALDGADALLILTEWDEFRGVDFSEVKKRLHTPLIFDGRNIFDRKEVEREGLEYYSMGS